MRVAALRSWWIGSGFVLKKNIRHFMSSQCQRWHRRSLFSTSCTVNSMIFHVITDKTTILCPICTNDFIWQVLKTTKTYIFPREDGNKKWEALRASDLLLYFLVSFSTSQISVGFQSSNIHHNVTWNPWNLNEQCLHCCSTHQPKRQAT